MPQSCLCHFKPAALDKAGLRETFRLRTEVARAGAARKKKAELVKDEGSQPKKTHVELVADEHAVSDIFARVESGDGHLSVYDMLEIEREIKGASEAARDAEQERIEVAWACRTSRPDKHDRHEGDGDYYLTPQQRRAYTEWYLRTENERGTPAAVAAAKVGLGEKQARRKMGAKPKLIPSGRPNTRKGGRPSAASGGSQAFKDRVARTEEMFPHRSVREKAPIAGMHRDTYSKYKKQLENELNESGDPYVTTDELADRVVDGIAEQVERRVLERMNDTLSLSKAQSEADYQRGLFQVYEGGMEAAKN